VRGEPDCTSMYPNIAVCTTASSSIHPMVFSLWQTLARTPMVMTSLLALVVDAEVFM
jgi:hypothetical protein